MKKQSSVKEILIPAIVLFLIAVVCTALLALTNDVTKQKIADIAVQTENEAKQAVLSDAASFSEAKTVTVDGTEYQYFEGLDANGAVVGYVIPQTTKSYGGALSLMVGISAADDKITGVQISEINDTPGLGMKAKGADFLNQFAGKTGELTVSKNASADNEIQAITSATISSRAVTTAVNNAFAVYEQVKAGAENG